MTFLIRQFIWLEVAPIAVLEGGVVSFVRSDHIGRPARVCDGQLWGQGLDRRLSAVRRRAGLDRDTADRAVSGAVVSE